jgi:hypothetical protein
MKSENDPAAAARADEFIRLILQYQPGALKMNSAPLNDTEAAKKSAQALATFRQELITLLAQQP